MNVYLCTLFIHIQVYIHFYFFPLALKCYRFRAIAYIFKRIMSTELHTYISVTLVTKLSQLVLVSLLHCTNFDAKQ